MPISPPDHQVDSDAVSAAVAANVRAEIARAGKSQSDVAQHIPLSQQSLSQRMQGRVPFRISELQRIADYLGISVNALVSETKAAS